MRVQKILIAFIFAFVLFAAVHRPLMIRFCPLDYREEIWVSSRENDLSPFLIASIIRVESNFRKEAVSPKGAIGLMQLMPSTAFWLAEIRGLQLDEDSLKEPNINISLGSYYFKSLMVEWGKVKALAAYNAGRGNVEKWLTDGVWDGTWERRADIPFPETRDFVTKVVMFEKWYKYLYQRDLSRELLAWNMN